jgi:hypothetical protein
MTGVNVEIREDAATGHPITKKDAGKPRERRRPVTNSSPRTCIDSVLPRDDITRGQIIPS